jgi:hypothetical protein
MHNLTYGELLKHLQGLKEEHLNQTVTTFSPDLEEYMPVESFDFTPDGEADVLDANHPILVMPA